MIFKAKRANDGKAMVRPTRSKKRINPPLFLLNQKYTRHGIRYIQNGTVGKNYKNRVNFLQIKQLGYVNTIDFNTRVC